LGRFLTDLSGADEVIVDGNRGVLIIDPDEETREHYIETQQTIGTFLRELGELRDLPAETKDGVRVQLMGNIEFPQEVQHCQDRGADGVGLYRTEFLYLNKTADPDEGEHVDAYMAVLRSLGSKPVVIRTLDLGADKFANRVEKHNEERNPSLGLRSVRLCLRSLALFKTQLRAILRASAYGDVRIMFPMISTLMELRQCKLILAEVKEDLEEENIAFNRKLPVGTMIEVPSAALMARELAREVDFFSIGTNDLIQYTLAADRTNETVANLYTAGDPAVLRLIAQVVAAAQAQASAGDNGAGPQRTVEVSVCGEMSGDPIYTLLLLGLGLRQLSVAPQNIPEIKKVIRTATLTEAKDVAAAALKLDTARDVNNYLRDRTRRILPEVVS
jgi:phosphotransferase system enzyme I (PtsI)